MSEKQESVMSKLERFDIKTETKILNALSKIFSEMTCLVSEEDICLVENVLVTDGAHVCLVVAKTNRAKLILRRFYDPELTHKEPCLTFRDSRNNIEAGNSLYSLDYFLSIQKVIKEVSDHFQIKLGTDSPCIVETDDFRFLLAPRIESE
jgi:hypothetical protein